MTSDVSPKRDLGSVLRATRQERGLSLRALAQKVGLPYSTLSKIENGKMALTFDRLINMAQALEVDIGRLVTPPGLSEDAPTPTGRRSVTLASAARNAKTERYSHTYIAPDLRGKMMSPILIDVEARSVEEVGGLIRHAGEEYLYVLAGTIELHSDLYRPLRLSAGDSVYFDSAMAHCYVKVGQEPCRVLAVCTGPGMRHLARVASSRTQI